MTITSPDFVKQVSIQTLFDRWRLAYARSRFWKRKLENKVPDAYMKYKNWQQETELLLSEIERRADLFPIEVVLFLIETGNGFQFNDSRREGE